MAALDIPALAKTNLDLAWGLVESVLSDVVVRLNPSGPYDPATDSQAITWGSTIEDIKGFLWADKNLEKTSSTQDDHGRKLEGITKKCLLRAADVGNVEIDTSAEIEEGGLVTWYVSGVDTPPGGAIIILDLYR